MSKGTLTAVHAERSDHHTMRKKLNIRSVQLIFSVIMFLTLAGLTGCQNEESEFLEKELEQEESGETADVEQKELKDTESGKASLTGTDLASETSPDSTESEGISKKKAEITESDQSSAIQQPASPPLPPGCWRTCSWYLATFTATAN